jgi:hypothetical protein
MLYFRCGLILQLSFLELIRFNLGFKLSSSRYCLDFISFSSLHWSPLKIEKNNVNGGEMDYKWVRYDWNKFQTQTGLVWTTSPAESPLWKNTSLVRSNLIQSELICAVSIWPPDSYFQFLRDSFGVFLAFFELISTMTTRRTQLLWPHN